MSEFDLIGPLSARAREIASKATDISETDRNELAALAQRTLGLRAKRNLPFVRSHKQFASSYVPSKDLLAAVNVALTLGRPLLLTGEPGSGKTLAAHWLANLLGLGDVLQFNVKSESRGQDLLYAFDAVSWFRESQVAALKESAEPVPKARHLKEGPLGAAFGWKGPPDRVRVVLIDEIDKAPRDFPNDLLNELDQMAFKVPEDDDREVRCDAGKRPIVVITSNQERRLPDPFLRRCVSHEIKLTPEILSEILRARLGGARDPDQSSEAWRAEAEGKIIASALPVWAALKEKPALSRTYTIDEFWRWLAITTLDADEAALLKVVAALERRQLDDPVLLARTLLTPDDLVTVQNRLNKGAVGVAH